MNVGRKPGRPRTRRLVISLLWFPVLCLVSCGGRTGSEIQYNQGRIEFAIPNVENSEAVESYAHQRIETTTRTLRARLSQPEVTQALVRANVKHEPLSLDEILNLDAQWQDSPADGPFVAARTDSACNTYIERVARVMPALAEVFVTDRRGLVVCQSGKTTDYYQADEKWWLDAYAGGKGAMHHGALEFDQSAETYAVAIYIPIVDAGSLVGVAKGAMRESSVDSDRTR